MATLTPLEQTLIPTVAALLGVALGLAGNWFLQWRKDLSDEKQRRDAAIAELLTATVDLVSGVQTIRAAYQGQSGWRASIRKAAVIISALGTSLPGEPGSPLLPRGRQEWSKALDWRVLPPFLDRMLGELRQLDGVQRTTALDLASTLLPRTIRFYAAVAVLTLGRDKAIANAVRKLTPAVIGLTEVIAANERTYKRARRRAEKALGEFREAADQRRR